MRFNTQEVGQIKSTYINDAVNSLVGTKEDEQAEATMRL